MSVVLQELKRYGLEPRGCNALWRAGILTMEALSGLTDQDVIKIRNIGDRGLLNLRGTLVNVAAGREVNPSGEIRYGPPKMLWADVPEDQRLTEDDVRRWIKRLEKGGYHEARSPAYLARRIRLLTSPDCHAAVALYRRAVEKQWYAPCSTSISDVVTPFCRQHGGPSRPKQQPERILDIPEGFNPPPREASERLTTYRSVPSAGYPLPTQEAITRLYEAIFGKPSVPGWECSVALVPLMTTLKDREARVLRLYLGLDEWGQRSTYRAVGRVLKLTGSRVSQIFHKGLRKLRQPTRRQYWHIERQVWN